MKNKIDIDIKVGILVSIGLGLFMGAILMLGGETSIFSRKVNYFARFESGEGLVKGAKVVLAGVNVGSVSKIEIEPSTRAILVDVAIVHKYGELIRKSTQAEVRTQGVLGDKYISLSAGNTEDVPLEPGSEITVISSPGLNQFLSQGETLLHSLNSIAFSLDRMLKTFEKNNRSDIFFEGIAQTAKNTAQISHKVNTELDQIQIKSAIKHLNEILEKVNRGSGTVGALINDPTLYDDLKSMVGEVNRNRIMRNIVRQTIRDSEEKAVKKYK